MSFRVRVLWGVVRLAERVAAWARFAALKLHETRGIILPGDDEITPPASVRRPGEDAPP